MKKKSVKFIVRTKKNAKKRLLKNEGKTNACEKMKKGAISKIQSDRKSDKMKNMNK
jgi:hypothetical protein